MRELKIFSGGANQKLADDICGFLHLPVGQISLSTFPDGEKHCKIEEDVRGRDCSGVLHTLMERELVRIVGRRKVVGRPLAYGTTSRFLEHFGFHSIQDLPKPGEVSSAG